MGTVGFEHGLSGPSIKVSNDGRTVQFNSSNSNDKTVECALLAKGIQNGKMKAKIHICSLNSIYRTWIGVQARTSPTIINSDPDIVAMIGGHLTEPFIQVMIGHRSSCFPGIQLIQHDIVTVDLDMDQKRVMMSVVKNGLPISTVIENLPDVVLHIAVGLGVGGMVYLEDLS